MNTPHVTILYAEDLPKKPFEEFEISLRHDGLVTRCEPIPNRGPYASIEWLVPTAIIVYVAKPYFEAFLKEAGKDHYHFLKNRLKAFTGKFTGEDAPTARITRSSGKAKSSSPKYSLVYSIVAELDEGVSAKLLLQTEFSDEDTDRAVELFFEFLHEFHDGNLSSNCPMGFRDAKRIGGTLLLAFDRDTQRLEVIDPIKR